MELLMGAGIDIEVEDPGGNKPLHWASVKGSTDAAKPLLRAGADVDATAWNSTTPLHWASVSDRHDMVRCLVEAGANVGATDEGRKTPLHHAAGRNSTSALRALLETDASLEAVDCKGRTPLHCASDNSEIGALTILVEAGANAKAIDCNGKTPLHYSCDNLRGAERVAVLVAAGANVDAIDDQGKTPLHCAAGSRLCWRDGTVKALVKARASLEIADKRGRTPLHYTADHVSADVTRVLVQAGANLDAVDECGRTTLHSALRNRALHVARCLAKAGANPQTTDPSGGTPLHCAALYAVRDLVETFIAAGANVQAVDEDGQTPLHCAAESGEEGIAQLLVDGGADVDARDDSGRTPLHWAAECGKVEVADVLVKAGADVQIEDDEGRTAAQISADGENSAVMELLTVNAADKHDIPEGGSNASFNSRSVQGTHQAEDTVASAGKKLFGDSRHDASEFSAEQFEVKSGLRLRYRLRARRHAAFLSSMTVYDFLGEKDDRSANSVKRVAPVKEKSKTSKDANRRLIPGAIVAKKYRIVSRSIALKGCMRTAVAMDTQRPVSLKFYKDMKLMRKHSSILEGYKKCSWACRFVETIDRDGMLPGCMVLQGSLQPLEDWLRTSAASIHDKLQMLSSLAMLLEGLHGQGYVHLGVCPQSVALCLDDQTCQFLSLDLVTSVDKQSKIQKASRYAAPELLSVGYKILHEPYQTAADMWAYGVIAYEMLTGEKLYDREFRDSDDLIKWLERESFPLKLNSVKDKKHRHFIKKFLNLDPKQRQTALAARKSSLLRSVAESGRKDAADG